ncbi:hypothetical protein HT136_19375 [Novosphingobium profundi]|uniref:hypothetical protein n=1 Tax=Novosphingobium profundi TaxID=1774954 RepID=UPI001BD96DBF|nr:hypothetical protein [Novosphingobium profundi]MBT0670532.1 hypothetical protein [Novosphingobium profundi]
MTINLNNGLIGLSILGGTSAYTSATSSLSSSESAAVTKAKEAFTLPETTPPWKEDEDTSSMSAQISAIKKLLSLVDPDAESDLEDLPDVQAAFTIYNTLDKLQTIAESAADSSTTATERAKLAAIFAQGLEDLQDYMSSVDTDMLTLNFGKPTSSVKTVAIDAVDVTGSVEGQGVSVKRDAAIEGLTGSEVFQFTLTKGTTTEVVTVDLSQTTQPPTLDSVAEAFNAAIGASQETDASGNPVVDENGDPVSYWKSNFTVEYNDEGEWGLVFNPKGVESVAIDQVGSQDALIVAAGETRKSSTSDAEVYRITNLDGTLDWERLGSIAGIDAMATERAEAEAKADEDYDPDDGTDYSVAAESEASAIVTDAEGFSYIVGTTTGDVGSSLSDGEEDLYLTKIDSEGNVVWQRSLGAAGSAEGAAITLTDSGEIVVAGTVSGAFSNSDDDETDILVTRFDTSGAELSSTAIRRVGDETATAVTVGDDGSIYVGGRTSTGDAFIAKLSATGTLEQRRTIDSGGIDTITALEVDSSGNILVLTRESGVSTLRQLDSSDISNELGSFTLGTADARAIAVSDDGQIAVVGATTQAIAGTQANALTGGRDAFATVLSADFSSATTTYIGTTDDDQADSVAWLNGSLYVGGRTTGTLEGTRAGTTDGFVAKIDAATGTLGTVSQFGLVASTFEPVQVSAVSGGDTALGALGLSRGTINQQTSSSLVSQTSLRVGDEFGITVDDGSVRTITIEEGETMSSLARKIRRITGTSATVSTSLVDGQTTLKITAAAGSTIELSSGASGKDALAKLGISAGKLITSTVSDDDETLVTPGGTFSLALSQSLSLSSETLASQALSSIKSALSMIQSAYRSLYWDDNKAAKVDGTSLITSSGSAYQQSRLASYQAALDRLTS